MSDNAVRELYARLLSAWNERDAGAFAALFVEDGLSIGFDGSQAAGPAEIADHLDPIFEDHPTASYVAKVRAIRRLGPDVASLHAIAGMIPPDQDAVNPGTNAIQTMLAQRGDAGWRVVVFQNTPAQYHGRPELVEAHTTELAPLAAAGRLLG